MATKKTAPDADRQILHFDNLLSAKILMLARSYKRLADRSLRARFGLSLQQCHLINLVGSLGPISFKHASEFSGLAKSHLSHLLSGLMEKGLIEKKADASDQRSIILSLSDRGRKMHELIFEASRERNELWLAGLSAAQRKMVRESIELLAERMGHLQPGHAPLSPAGIFAEDDGREAAGETACDTVGTADGAPVMLDASLARQLYEHLGGMLDEERK